MSANPSITNKKDLKDFLRADLEVHGALDISWARRQTKANLRFLRALRYAEYRCRQSGSLIDKILRPFAHWNLRRHSVRTGISIPINTFGKGLFIPHFGSIVVNTQARFGDYCCIQNNVNIGKTRNGVPTGGDFIYVSPGAVIYGDVSIGTGSVIGANAVVGTNVDAHTTWAGAPARKISDNDSSALLPDSIITKMQPQ